MSHSGRITKLLLDRVTEREEPDRPRSRASPLEEEIVRFLLEVIENVHKCTSYEVESETTLDHDDDDVFSDFEDESIDPNFDETEDVESPPITMNFALYYMKKVIDYYDARDSTGRKRHTWKSTKHQFKSIPHRQYIARFRHYIEQNGTKREKMWIIDDFVYDRFEEARERVISIHDRD
ncbi:unnamed protein product [Rotaria sp. Silwood2]|nr:unnamed protein product [Rotaria sp. Silwood2]CAF2949111.1 unnamed protein product [Rotaria sp. Silwood2]CAF3332512.1 unnamed protein product [Rotaria sp. Silwood2]CAF3408058.1 unnamed protein product [Rotaria sp. Silwood2]CAF4079631.1 unnamed protein product [Rotaria sp. Silwood2]